MSGIELTVLISMGLSFWYILDGMRTKEVARLAGRKACEQYGVLFLDDTVVLNRTRLRRNRGGRLQWQRDYAFEFTSDGGVRYKGSIVMLGKRALHTYLQPYRQIMPDDIDAQ